MDSKRIVLAGGSGFLGQALQADLTAAGYRVIVLTRSPVAGAKEQARWDGRSLEGDWARHLDGAAAVVNLTGKSVNCRYTPQNRAAIIASRLDSVRIVDEAIARCATPPRALVQAGSLAIYGDAGETVCDESTPAAQGFSAEVCQRWEAAFNEASSPGTRRVLLRIGFVLGRGGGALGTLAGLTRCGLGGTVGSGRQYISWIHLSDMGRMFRWAMERDTMTGVFNATGPNPVRNAEFMRELRRALGRPWSPPAPTWAVHIGSWLMRTDPSLALTGRRCVPARFAQQGFDFQFPELQPALTDLFAAPGHHSSKAG